jgi:hypothetical protein
MSKDVREGWINKQAENEMKRGGNQGRYMGVK